MNKDDVTFLPKYELDPEYNAGILRQSIPLMAKHHVSPHPINYAIWFEYASRQNARLTHAVDDLLTQKVTFDDTVSLDLYKTYICNASVTGFEKINSSLNTLIVKTSSSVQDSGDQASQVEDQVKARATELDSVHDVSEMKSVLAGIVAETSQLVNISESLKKELNAAHQEMEALRLELTKVREMATIDALTGLLNRRAFDSTLSELMVANTGEGEHSLMILDLDHFKKVNDTFGHLVGDKVIRFTAALVQKKVNEGHFPARYGGEEMAVIMPDTRLEQAAQIAESVRETLAKSQLKQKDNGLSIGKVTVSIGVSSIKPGDTVESFIARADGALYEAKQNGRNKVVRH